MRGAEGERFYAWQLISLLLCGSERQVKLLFMAGLAGTPAAV